MIDSNTGTASPSGTGGGVRGYGMENKSHACGRFLQFVPWYVVGAHACAGRPVTSEYEGKKNKSLEFRDRRNMKFRDRKFIFLRVSSLSGSRTASQAAVSTNHDSGNPLIYAIISRWGSGPPRRSTRWLVLQYSIT